MGTENRTNQVDMKLLRLLTLLLAVVALSCKPEALPGGDNSKENTENTDDTGNGDDDGPSRPDRPGGENGDGGNDDSETQESFYVIVDENFSDWSGDYLITYTSSGSINVFDSFSSDSKGASTTDLGAKLTEEGIPSNDGDPYKAIVNKVGTYYSVYLTGSGYLGMTKSKNNISKSSTAPTASTNEYLWNFSYKSGSSVYMTNVGHNGYRLQWNSSDKCFRCSI